MPSFGRLCAPMRRKSTVGAFVSTKAFIPTKKAPATTGAFRSLNDANSLQRLEPVVHVLVDLVLGEAVALLQLAFELFAASFDHVEIVVGEFAPLLLGGALELLPVAFNPVPIHRHLLLR